MTPMLSLRSCLVLGVSLGVRSAWAEVPAPETPVRETPATEATRAMTLPEALAYARAHQPQIRAAQARLAAARADARVPGAQWLPTFGGSAQIFAATANNTTGTYVTTGDFDVPRIGATRGTGKGTLRPWAATFVGAGGRQEVFDFGRIAAQSAAEDALVDVQRQSARTRELDVTFDVEEAYYAVYAARAVLKASEDAFVRSQAHRDLAKAGVDSGLRSPIELTRAEAELAKIDIGRIKATGGLVVAQNVLAAAVGDPNGAIDAAGAPPAFASLPSLPRAMDAAAHRDPRILQALAELKATEERTRAIGAERRPEFFVTGTISGRAGGAAASGTGTIPAGDGFVPRVPNWSVGLVFSWPLFDPTVNARVDASRARETVRREELAVVRQQEIAAIRQAYASVSVARAALPGLGRAADAARANYAQADARFKAGLGTAVELADAESLRTEAEVQLVLGEFQLARTRATFGRAIIEGA